MRRILFTILLVLCSVSFVHASTLNIVQQPVKYGYKTANGRTIDTIIIHATYNPGLKTQTLAGAMAEWKANNVSPHYAIDRAGKIYQLVAEKNIAYHAGVSALPNGDTNVNTRSIGIEMVYSNTDTPSAAQYASLQSLVTDIEGRYAIRYVLGHEQIAPGRKVDPWNFDYTKLISVFKPATIAFPEPVTLSSDIFQSNIAPLTTQQQAVMKLYSYRASCPVVLGDLRAVNVSYVGFDGVTHQGTLVVNASIADSTIAAFKVLFDQKFPIRSIAPIDEYQGVDALSMAADNTSAFNCRPVAGTKTFSEHSYGTAIDINPKENPSFATATAGQAFDQSVKGVVNTAVVTIFKNNGFKWGGDWTSKKDYQHFSVSGK